MVSTATLLALVAVPLAAAQYDYGSSSSVAGSASSTAAATSVPTQSGVHQVQVGGNGKLVFTPDTVKASPGDKVQYIFNPIAHGVVQSSFSNPCHPINSSAISSGIMQVQTGTGSMTFEITINDTSPIWIYCPQTTLTHCQSGMSMVINPP